MPRDGSGVYSKPAGIDASPNTTIESADWNAFTADVEQDANTPRPVVAGGSGSSTAVGGNDNLNKAGADMASASTLNLATSTGTLINVTGTTTITALGVLAAGAERVLVFTGVLTLTYNATTLILPGAANIITAAGDTARFRSLGGGSWKCVDYQRQSVAPFSQATLDAIANGDAASLKKAADNTAVSAGFTAAIVDDGTKSTGTYTPSPLGGNYRKITNNGAFTLAAPTDANCYNMTIDITNGASAGAITFTGFVTGYPQGDVLTTVNAAKFKLHISKTDIGTTGYIEAL
jgi:hypothetical protein